MFGLFISNKNKLFKLVNSFEAECLEILESHSHKLNSDEIEMIKNFITYQARKHALKINMGSFFYRKGLVEIENRLNLKKNELKFKLDEFKKIPSERRDAFFWRDLK